MSIPADAPAKRDFRSSVTKPTRRSLAPQHGDHSQSSSSRPLSPDGPKRGAARTASMKLEATPTTRSLSSRENGDSPPRSRRCPSEALPSTRSKDTSTRKRILSPGVADGKIRQPSQRAATGGGQGSASASATLGGGRQIGIRRQTGVHPAAGGSSNATRRVTSPQHIKAASGVVPRSPSRGKTEDLSSQEALKGNQEEEQPSKKSSLSKQVCNTSRASPSAVSAESRGSSSQGQRPLGRTRTFSPGAGAPRDQLPPAAKLTLSPPSPQDGSSSSSTKRASGTRETASSSGRRVLSSSATRGDEPPSSAKRMLSPVGILASTPANRATASATAALRRDGGGAKQSHNRTSTDSRGRSARRDSISRVGGVYQPTNEERAEATSSLRSSSSADLASSDACISLASNFTSSSSYSSSSCSVSSSSASAMSLTSSSPTLSLATPASSSSSSSALSLSLLLLESKLAAATSLLPQSSPPKILRWEPHLILGGGNNRPTPVPASTPLVTPATASMSDKNDMPSTQPSSRSSQSQLPCSSSSTTSSFTLSTQTKIAQPPTPPPTSVRGLAQHPPKPAVPVTAPPLILSPPAASLGKPPTARLTVTDAPDSPQPRSSQDKQSPEPSSTMSPSASSPASTITSPSTVASPNASSQVKVSLLTPQSKLLAPQSGKVLPSSPLLGSALVEALKASPVSRNISSPAVNPSLKPSINSSPSLHRDKGKSPLISHERVASSTSITSNSSRRIKSSSRTGSSTRSGSQSKRSASARASGERVEDGEDCSTRRACHVFNGEISSIVSQLSSSGSFGQSIMSPRYGAQPPGSPGSPIGRAPKRMVLSPQSRPSKSSRHRSRRAEEQNTENEKNNEKEASKSRSLFERAFALSESYCASAGASLSDCGMSSGVESGVEDEIGTVMSGSDSEFDSGDESIHTTQTDDGSLISELQDCLSDGEASTTMEEAKRQGRGPTRGGVRPRLRSPNGCYERAMHSSPLLNLDEEGMSDSDEPAPHFAPFAAGTPRPPCIKGSTSSTAERRNKPGLPLYPGLDTSRVCNAGPSDPIEGQEGGYQRKFTVKFSKVVVLTNFHPAHTPQDKPTRQVLAKLNMEEPLRVGRARPSIDLTSNCLESLMRLMMQREHKDRRKIKKKLIAEEIAAFRASLQAELQCDVVPHLLFEPRFADTSGTSLKNESKASPMN
eukprot:GHVN01001353.1.p1 GENE.GHVN01001353.1~~GHVN01001353.1.p1  ORF type:complete len:1351 (-),score=257.89 GHVN01001353.1:4816-8367(-)